MTMAIRSRTFAVYHTADLIISDGGDTWVYGDPCEPGTGAHMENGWVDPSWSRWEVYGDRDSVMPTVYDPNLDWCDCAADDLCCSGNFEECPCGTGPVLWLARLINESLPGGVELSNGQLTGSVDCLYAADTDTDWSNGGAIEASRCIHPEGFTDDEILQAVAWSTYMPFNVR